MPFFTKTVKSHATLGRQLVQRAHVGIENEMSGYSLVLLQPDGAGWKNRPIGYGVRAAQSEGNSPVHELPLAQIQVEGATDKKKGIPEHISGPLRAQTPSFEYMRRALGILQHQFRMTVSYGTPAAEHEEVKYHLLRTVLEKYNRELEFLAKVRQDKRWHNFRMTAKDGGGAQWMVGFNKGKSPNELNTQANLEIPFRAIGQQSGGVDLGDQFQPRNKRIFLDCRKYAQQMAQNHFAADRRRLMRKTSGAAVKLERLNSLFTLYYFAVVMHYYNQRPSGLNAAREALQRGGGLGRGAQSAENIATKEKNQWGLLPKVEWGSLMKDAISDVDREILDLHFNGNVKWMALKNQMSADIMKIEPEIGKGFADAMHEKIIKKQSHGLSSTGKPLPVELLPATKTVLHQTHDSKGNLLKEREEKVAVVEPMIVFEYRHGGFDQTNYRVGHLGKPEESLTQQLLTALDGLQGFA